MTVFDSDTLEHPTTDELQALFSGGLDRLRREEVESHLLECDQCCSLIDQLSSAEDANVDHDPFVQLVREVETSAESWCDSLHDAIENEDPQDAKEWHRSIRFFMADHPRYEIQDVIGSGGMGVVFRTRHRMMRRNVVLKVINRRLMLHKSAAARFRREIRAAARLSHPAIVAAYDSEEYRGLHYLVMEYVEGTNLARVVEEQGPFDLARACDIISQAAEGLQHAFERRMVHRDIKPQNLMLTPDGKVKILDFGLARFVKAELADTNDGGTDSVEFDEGLSAEQFSAEGLSAEMTQLNTLLGTLGYAAPEQMYDSSSADIRSDIYSLGAVFHFLLTGRPPDVIGGPGWHTGRGGETEVNVQAETPCTPAAEPTGLDDPGTMIDGSSGESSIVLGASQEDIPSPIKPIFNRMLARNPDDRFQIPAELVAALSAVELVADPQVSSEAKPPADSQASPQPRRKSTQPTFLDRADDAGRRRSGVIWDPPREAAAA
ncbi:MAG: serine/threonine-protein kinase [Planctomycetota bacterium]|nr:serine/threonine-protein kinase [Planctomycetota bacterium]